MVESRLGWISVIAIVVLFLVFAAGAIRFDRYSAEHSAIRRDAALGAQDVDRVQRSAGCVDNAKRFSYHCLIEVPGLDSADAFSELNLRVQQEMAEWAFAMFVASLAGVIITAFATLYVALTFYETRRALNEAKRTTEAAERSNQIQSNAALDQARSYVAVVKAEVEWHEGNSPRVFLVVRNSGKTPARWWAYRFCVVSYDTPPPFDAACFAGRPLTKWYGILPESKRSVAVWGDEITSAVSKCSLHEGKFRIDGEVQYETYFGERFVSEFSFSGVVSKQRWVEVKGGKDWVPGKSKLSQNAQPLRCFFRLQDDGSPHHTTVV